MVALVLLPPLDRELLENRDSDYLIITAPMPSSLLNTWLLMKYLLIGLYCATVMEIHAKSHWNTEKRLVRPQIL